MTDHVEVRSYGRVFNEVAGEYDRHRPAYPEALVDRACEVAGLARGAAVLEIGCGTGQLTRSLLARGLRVTAVEPGEQLIARAREQLAGAGEVQYVNARLEDAARSPALLGGAATSRRCGVGSRAASSRADTPATCSRTLSSPRSRSSSSTRPTR